jgi:hypothetical protein
MGHDWTGKRTRRMKMMRGRALVFLAGSVTAFLVAASHSARYGRWARDQIALSPGLSPKGE